MTVKKPKRYKSGTFIQLARTSLSNPNLSWGALGLWHYMLSKPANWKFSQFELENATKDGRYSTISYLKELISLELVKKILNRDKQGRITSRDYQVVETSEKLATETASKRKTASLRKLVKMNSPKAEKPYRGENFTRKNLVEENLVEENLVEGNQPHNMVLTL